MRYGDKTLLYVAANEDTADWPPSTRAWQVPAAVTDNHEHVAQQRRKLMAAWQAEASYQNCTNEPCRSFRVAVGKVRGLATTDGRLWNESYFHGAGVYKASLRHGGPPDAAGPRPPILTMRRIEPPCTKPCCAERNVQ
jgi:hypothetical protein